MGTRTTSLPSRAWVGALVVVAMADLWSGEPVGSQTVTPMSAEARAQLAPNGRLRAALNYGNFLLVSSRTPEHTGVAPDLARELARRAGATLEFVGYENAGLAADAAAQNAWDVAFIGAEPARAAVITFSPAYVEIESTYLVPQDSPFRTAADVDRAGVRVASAARAAYTLYLQRSLKYATVVETEGLQGSADMFSKGGFQALAGLKPRLLEDVKRIPGTRLVDGRFTAVQQSMGVRKERTAAAAYLDAFGREIKASGLLRSLIDKYGAHGLSIAAQTFVPADFAVPRSHEGRDYILRPLGPDLVEQDYAAYMGSIEHIRKTFGGGKWPYPGITRAEALTDVEGEQARFDKRESFTYAVLTKDGKTELGCVYISPTKTAGFDARVRTWVIESRAASEAQLRADVKAWIASAWPFRSVEWP